MAGSEGVESGALSNNKLPMHSIILVYCPTLTFTTHHFPNGNKFMLMFSLIFYLQCKLQNLWGGGGGGGGGGKLPPSSPSR